MEFSREKVKRWWGKMESYFFDETEILLRVDLEKMWDKMKTNYPKELWNEQKVYRIYRNIKDKAQSL